MFKTTLLALVATAALGATLMAADEDMTAGRVRSEIKAAVDEKTTTNQEMADVMSGNPDRAFAAMVISHARMQKQISDLVAEKATNPEIKKYAKEMSDELDKMSQRVSQAAEKEGITLQQNRMLPHDTAMLNFMKQLPVATLERQYIFHQAGATQTHLLMAQWAAKHAEKAAIKDAANDIAMTLKTRHDTATKLAQAEVTGGRMATEQP